MSCSTPEPPGHPVSKTLQINRPMTKKFLFAIAIILVVAGAIATVKALQIKALVASGASFAMPPSTVTSATVKSDQWEVTIPAVGSISAVQGVTVSTELAGTVMKIDFESGAEVKAGQLLVQMDVSSEEAQLASADAQAELMRIELDRAKTLSGTRAISESELDSSDTKYKQSLAEVDSIRATIAKKTIRAPFDGRAGIRKIDIGQFANAGTPIVSIQSLDPVYADFTVPQQEISSMETGLEVRVTTDAFPEEIFEGKLTAIGSELERATRSIPIQATLANRDGKLRPGMFAQVRVVRPTKRDVLMIPATSVVRAPYSDSVFVIEDAAEGGGKVIRQQFIRVGDSRGDFVAVVEGLEAGQEIVGVGVFKLRNGSPVVVDNTLAPKPELNPVPEEG